MHDGHTVAGDDGDDNGAGAASTVDIACEVIREAIRSGRFAGGDRIRELEVCEMAQVSRTSVRHALALLAAEGFVELRPNRGACDISPKSIRPWIVSSATRTFQSLASE